MNHSPIVRAVDVGYGHVKFTDGRDPESNEIRTDSIPSQSPAALVQVQKTGRGESSFSGGVVMRSRDTFRVPVGDRTYEVGRDVHLATVGTNVTEVLDREFALSDAYAARLFGAINYMLPSLPDHEIDILVLGLPLTTYQQRRADLENRFVGTHVIDDRGATVRIDACCVYPQPLGSYAVYIAGTQGLSEAPLALIIDIGYNTIDWFVCHGLIASDVQSSAVERGMGEVLRAMADDIIAKHHLNSAQAQIVRTLDRSLVDNKPFKQHGEVIDLGPHFAAGEVVIEEAAQIIVNRIGSGGDLDVIILTGGGATLFAPVIRNSYLR